MSMRVLYVAVLATLVPLLVQWTVAQSQEITINYDARYDNPNGSMSTTICSNIQSTWPTYGSFPSYPFVGGSPVITYYGDPDCGSCWKLTSSTSGNSVYFTVIDHSQQIVISLEGFELLTGYTWPNIPNYVTVTEEEVARSYCGT